MDVLRERQPLLGILMGQQLLRVDLRLLRMGLGQLRLGLELLGMTLPQLKVGLSLFDFLEKVVQCLASWAVEP